MRFSSLSVGKARRWRWSEELRSPTDPEGLAWPPGEAAGEWPEVLEGSAAEAPGGAEPDARDPAPVQGEATGPANSWISIPFPALPVPAYVRMVEIPVALAALILSLPAMLAIAAAIRLDTPGPALFFQTRVGRNGRFFKFVKFRTLYVDARRRFPELYAYRYDERQLEALRFKTENDPRVTPRGQWLRRSSLDELPNFWNVLIGDMALVGPRPEIPEMLRYYRGDMLRKFTVRPGITGIAQTSGRGRLRFYDTVEHDLEYVRNQSLRLDLKILLKTVRMILLRDGAF